MKRLPVVVIAAATALAPGCQLLIPGDSPDTSDLPSTTARAIAASWQHSCALTAEGGVRCWGYGAYGQLGAGMPEDTSKRFMAQQVIGLESGVAAIATNGDGVSTCALTDAGGVKCWGDNERGQLGDGTTTTAFAPVDVVGLGAGVSAIAVGAAHACAITADGGVKCWGDNEDGQLGNGTRESSSTPVDVIGLPSAVASLAAGGEFSCAVTTAGAVWCWGDNTFAQCAGDEYTWTFDHATPIAQLTGGVTAIAAGYRHVCAQRAAGSVACWGLNEDGQLGNGTGGTVFDQSYVPVDVVGLGSEVKQLRLSAFYSMALDADGGVKAWGTFNLDPDYGPVVSDQLTPVDTIVTSGAVELSAGEKHACFLDADGAAFCWGDNESGQVGWWDRNLGVHYEPEPVPVDSLP